MPSVTKTMARNFSWLTIGQILSRGFNAATIIYLARVLGVAAFGLLSFVQAFFAYLSLLVDAGLSTFGTREIANLPENSAVVLLNILVLRVLIALIILFLSLIILFLLPIANQLRWLFFLTFLLLFHKALNTEWVFQGLEKMEYIAFSRVLYSVLMFISVIFFVGSPADLLRVPFIIATSGIIVAIVFVYLLFKIFVPFRLGALSLSKWKNYLIEAMPLAASIFFIQIYYCMDTIMLGFMSTTVIVGYYNAAYKVFLVIAGFYGLWQASAFPVVSRRFNKAKEKAERFLHKFAKLSLLVVIPFTFLLACFSGQIIVLIYGQEYLPATIALRILIWNLVVIAINGIYGPLILIVAGKQKEFMWTVGFGALMNFVLNFILIPPFGFVGAAIATLMTEFIVTILVFYFAQKVIQIPFAKYLVVPIAVTGLLSLLLSTLRFFIKDMLLFSLLFSLVFIFAYTIILLFIDRSFFTSFFRELKGDA